MYLNEKHYKAPLFDPRAGEGRTQERRLPGSFFLSTLSNSKLRRGGWSGTNDQRAPTDEEDLSESGLAVKEEENGGERREVCETALK